MNVEQQRALALARARRRRARVVEIGQDMIARPGERIAGAFEAAADMPEVDMTSTATAAGRGAAQGATLGFYDELRGLAEAGGLAPDDPMSLGAVVRGGYRRLTGTDEPGAYDAGAGRVRGELDVARAEHPVASMGGEIAGAIATAPILPVARAGQAAGIGGRMAAGAKTGAAYGAAYGAGSGEGLQDRLLGAATGLGTGALVGAAAPAAVRAVQAAGRGISNVAGQIAAPIRGLVNRENEAARRIAIAMQADNAIPQPRLSLADEAAALRAGQPVLNIDRGGETVRALARSSANTSPQGRSQMETAISDRFAAQGSRVIDTVRRIVGNTTVNDARTALQNQARQANRPAYRTAYNDPAAQSMWDAGLEQLATAPVVQNAIRQAAITGRNKAALDGFPPVVNPFKLDPKTGFLTLRPGVTPTLQFWDHVKRNLDGMNTGEARQAARVLREYLDELVPAYKTARAGAASFFGAQDALEAGEQFVSSRMTNDVARAGIARMSAPEKKLFAEGFADALVRKVAETGDRRNVINSIFLQSMAAKERIELALGPQKARELEAFLRVEDLLDRARTAFGNSTTARQLTELGLAGGAGAYGIYTDDWQTSGTVLAGLLARRGLLGIDRGVAQRVGEMLASPDPAMVQKGLALIARNPRYMDSLRAADIPAVLGGTEAATEAIAN